MYMHLLIATDGSDISMRAVARGLDLAKQLDARVTVVTVSQMWSPMRMAQEAEAGDDHPIEHYESAAGDCAAKILKDAAEASAKAGVACETVYLPNSKPSDAICEYAGVKRCDMIVMGTHGRGSLANLLIGSQAAAVIARSAIPVLIVR